MQFLFIRQEETSKTTRIASNFLEPATSYLLIITKTNRMKDHRKKEPPTINAGSMADVAFLLLIFFLVVTTIDVDKGITVKLPPWCPDCSIEVPPGQAFSIKVNADDQLLVEGEELIVGLLKEETKQYLRKKGKKSIISIKNDRATSYSAYIEVYNELKAAYNEIWNEEANAQFNSSYEDLNAESKMSIRKQYPLVISEAEPSDVVSSE